MYILDLDLIWITLRWIWCILIQEKESDNQQLIARLYTENKVLFKYFQEKLWKINENTVVGDLVKIYLNPQSWIWYSKRRTDELLAGSAGAAGNITEARVGGPGQARRQGRGSGGANRGGHSTRSTGIVHLINLMFTRKVELWWSWLLK